MSWTHKVQSILSPLQEMPHQMTSTTPTDDPLIILFLAIISLLLILLTVFMSIFLYRYIRDQKMQKENIRDEQYEKKQDLTPDTIDRQIFARPSQWEILSLEEQAVIDLLIQNKGNLLQKDVPIHTNFSKSTVTRILSRLEDQDLVYRSPAGRGYRIFLKELEAF